MVDVKPEDMLDVRNVALLREFIPVVAAEVRLMERALENRVMGDALRGELTPEKAQQAWFEKLAYRRLLGNLSQKAQLGQAKAASAIAALEMKG